MELAAVAIEKERLGLKKYQDCLRELLLQQIKGASAPNINNRIKELLKYPFWQACELTWALTACNCLLAGLEYPYKNLKAEASGSVLLLKEEHFIWGPLPYPRLHAELGGLLAFMAVKGKEEYSDLALKMGNWQKELLDHKGRPFFSPWHQEGSFSYREIVGSFYFLFNLLSYIDKDKYSALAASLFKQFASLQGEQTPFFDLVECFPLLEGGDAGLQEPGKELFYDPSCLFLKKRSKDATIALFGTGCKSSMGLFLSGEGGIVSFGPQLLPVGNFQDFGIAGTIQTSKNGFQPNYESNDKEDALSFFCRAGSQSEVEGSYKELKETGFSGLWIESLQTIVNDNELILDYDMHETSRDLAFAFFIKARAAIVSGSHKLNPRSLDRYRGPPMDIVFDLCSAKCTMQPQRGIKLMEVIPLAGDDSFWSADFLIVFTLGPPPYKWIINT